MPFREGTAYQGAEQPTPYRTPDRKEADIVGWGSLAFLLGLESRPECRHLPPQSPPTHAPVLLAVRRSHSVSILVAGIRSGRSRSSTISVALCSRSLASRRACPLPETRTHWLSLSSWNIDGWCAGMGCGVCAIPKAGKTMKRARSQTCLSMIAPGEKQPEHTWAT